MIQVREITEIPELSAALNLQRLIWGFDEIELLPLRLFVVATRIGGQVLGAFDGSRMIGFSIAIPGLKPDDSTYWHSNMMGVLEEYRNAGVGRMLKLSQRQGALAQGIQLIEWTFDPLELKNAFFNIERLGAVVRRYVLNQYGTTTSHLHGGLPTDRCVAEWHIASPRVALTVSGNERPHSQVLTRIEVPAQAAGLRASDPDAAREIQARVSEQFLEQLNRGLAVIGFERANDHGAYLLGKWHSE